MKEPIARKTIDILRATGINLPMREFESSFITDLATIRDFQIPPRPTIEQIRNAVLDMNFFCIGKEAMAPSDRRRYGSVLPKELYDAVAAGRLFDIGFLPNKLMKAEAARSARLYQARRIGHPFHQPYALFHTWDYDLPRESLGLAFEAEARALVMPERPGAIYYVVPLDDELGGSFAACEFEPVLINNKLMLMVGDIIHVQTVSTDEAKYTGSYTPSPTKAMFKGNLPDQFNQANSFCNIGDPVMLSLLLLNAEGVPVDRVIPSPKLNKARIKNRKPPIPPHWQVNTFGYVTALTERGRRPKRLSLGGHHASPIPHLRRAHERHLHERHGGGVIWVRDAVVNLTDPNAPLARSFYQLHRETTHRQNNRDRSALGPGPVSGLVPHPSPA